MLTDQQVYFDHGPTGTGALFATPEAIIRADTPAEVDAAFAAIEDAQARGLWLAGYVSYEFGYLTSPKLAPLLPETREVPLLQFGAFKAPRHREWPEAGEADLRPPVPVWSRAEYGHAFERLHGFIEAGDIYQANLTFPMASRFSGGIGALYAALRARQSVPHGALVALEGPAILSRSPELFFALSAEGALTARPMKGTAPRGATVAEDDALRAGLEASEKDRAENLMIVDLLRNDMARVSRVGSVAVPELFAVERYETLHQMTSRITSRLRPGVSFRQMLEALFPCGSVNGAPKIRAMQIIRDLEAEPRGAYCGAVGWIAPTGAMQFNVAIRTLLCREDGTVRMNVGGGIVYDSRAQDEYDEALLKSRFASLEPVLA